jgi:hypothetical protein
MTRTPKRELNSCRPRTPLIRGLTTDRLQRFRPFHFFDSRVEGQKKTVRPDLERVQ